MLSSKQENNCYLFYCVSCNVIIWNWTQDFITVVFNFNVTVNKIQFKILILSTSKTLPCKLLGSPFIEFHLIYRPDCSLHVLHTHKTLVQAEIMTHSILEITFQFYSRPIFFVSVTYQVSYRLSNKSNNYKCVTNKRSICNMF